MAREIVRFKSEEHTDRARSAAFLRSLADKVESGDLTLRRGNEKVEVTLPEHLVLEVKLEKEETTPVKYSLEVELEWREGDDSYGGGVKLA